MAAASPPLSAAVVVSPSTPALPCFSDVVEAQRWAATAVQRAADEANRRGCRGSRAWEDVWRDALWTLAVQKRCVEIEARKRNHSPPSPSATSTRPAQTPIGAMGSVAVSAPVGAALPFSVGEALGIAEVALHQGSELFQQSCVASVQRQFDVVEDRLASMLAVVRSARGGGAQDDGPPTGEENGSGRASPVGGDRPRGVSGRPPEQRDSGGGGSVGAASVGVARLTTVAATSCTGEGICAAAQGHQAHAVHAHGALLDLQRQLAACTAREEAEAASRCEAELRCGVAERRVEELEAEEEQVRRQLRRAVAEAELRGEAEAAAAARAAGETDLGRQLQFLEADREAARQDLRRAELRLEDEARQAREAEARWQQRLAALQKQLRRTEVALGEAFVLGGRRLAHMDGVLDTEGVDCPDVTACGVSGGVLSAGASNAALELWRQARRQGGC